jgi:hypothetical protein
MNKFEEPQDDKPKDLAPSFDYDAQFERILDMQAAIPMDGSVSVLTGGNGKGKSLVRKFLAIRAKDDHKKSLVHASMQLRTAMHSELGGLGCMFRDNEEASTSSHTAYLVQTACNSIHGGFLCIDEVEVGLGEETILGIVKWLNANLRGKLKGTLGCLVITHSRIVVRDLDYDHWFSLDGFATAKEWLDRRIVPTDIAALRHDDLGFFRHVIATCSDRKAKGEPVRKKVKA